MFVVELLDGLLRPVRCLGCGAPTAWPCCPRCLPSEPGPGRVGPWRLDAAPEVPLWALGPYRDGLRAAVLAGKLDGQPAALTELGRRLGEALAAAGIGADLVTWIAGRSAGLPRDHAERIGAGVAAHPRPARGRPPGPGPTGPTGRRLRVHRRRPGAAWPAAVSWWSTTWPPPAAPWPARPPPCARPAPAGSRRPSWPSPPPPSTDRDLGPAWSERSHCVVVTCFRV